MKLHLGCGSVYLEGYVNIDSPQNLNAFLAEDRPDLVSRWKTTEDRYYDNQPPLILNTTRNLEFVADVLQDITNLTFPGESASKILIVQTFEHLSNTEVEKALKNWHKVLRIHGCLQIHVPDIEESIDQFLNANTRKEREAVARLIFGTRKGPLFYHHYGYTKEGLAKLLEDFGFGHSKFLPTIHPYPSFVISVEKV
jgi:SAM-dependent methyltransferase